MASIAVPSAVARLINAVNSGDTEQFLDSFSQDGVVDDCGRRFQGRAAIETWSATELIGDNCRLTVNGTRSVDDETEILADVVSMGFNGPTSIAFRLRDDEVELMRLDD